MSDLGSPFELILESEMFGYYFYSKLSESYYDNHSQRCSGPKFCAARSANLKIFFKDDNF
jgi:hypothetical protein